MSRIDLRKGQRLSLDKNGGKVVASNGWTAQNKDYDLKALVRYRDGRKPIYVGAANVDEVLSTQEGAVRHHGDVTQPGEREKISIAWHPDIASVALSSYSARENGPGSFKEYGVFVEVANGLQTVSISAQDASASRSSYTLCFGEVVFGEATGELTVINHEMYSKSGSERRIAYKGDEVKMDAGPEGRKKN